MKKLKVGIIGCGAIANNKHLPSLAKQDQYVEMTAFCDLIVEKAEAEAKRYGAPGAKVYTDYRILLEDASLDVIHVCTPNRSHSEISIAALEAGKHVMCEKPMAKTAAEARKMLEAARKSGKLLTIGYQNRFTPTHQVMKQVVDRGDLGEIYYAKAHALRRRAVPIWGVFLNEEEQGGGPLIDIGTHALDLTLWMMNNYSPKAVLGQTFHKLGSQTNTGNPGGDWDPAKFTVEDSAFGLITMKNGATIVLESSWALNTLDIREAQTTLCGTKGGLDTCAGIRYNSVEFNQQIVKTIDTTAAGALFFEGSGTGDPCEIECAQWIQAVLKETTPLVLPEQALCVSEILEAIYTSARTGQAVYFD